MYVREKKRGGEKARIDRAGKYTRNVLYEARRRRAGEAVCSTRTRDTYNSKKSSEKKLFLRDPRGKVSPWITTSHICERAFKGHRYPNARNENITNKKKAKRERIKKPPHPSNAQ